MYLIILCDESLGNTQWMPDNLIFGFLAFKMLKIKFEQRKLSLTTTMNFWLVVLRFKSFYMCTIRLTLNLSCMIVNLYISSQRFLVYITKWCLLDRFLFHALMVKSTLPSCPQGAQTFPSKQLYSCQVILVMSDM